MLGAPDDEMLVFRLRTQASEMDTPDLISFLVQELGDRSSQFEVIRLLKAAFPAIPLRLLTEACTSRRVIGATGIGDDELVALLGDKLPRP